MAKQIQATNPGEWQPSPEQVHDSALQRRVQLARDALGGPLGQRWGGGDGPQHPDAVKREQADELERRANAGAADPLPPAR